MNRFVFTSRLIHKGKLYIPAITIVAISLTLTFIVAISLYRNIHREQLHLRDALEREGVALINAFSALVCSECISQDSHQEEFQQLVQGVTGNPDIAYIAFLSPQGEVIAHSGLDENGVVSETEAERLNLSARLPKTGETLTKLKNEEHIFELITEFYTDTSSRPQAPKSFILLGLKTTGIELAHAGDIKHAILMAVMLLVIGSASLYFIVIVQNYYLVDRALDRMKTYTHHIVSSMPNGLISLDESGYITTFNKAAADMLSRSPSEVKGGHFSNIFETNVVKAIEGVLEVGQPIIEREIQYTLQPGETIPFSLSATQLLDDTGKSLGSVILLRDLREVKELQERARRAEHLASIGRLAAAVAHEIRNPLSSIRGFTQYFAAQFRDGTDERKYTTVMISEIDRLNRVIEELLDYSRPLKIDRQETQVETILDHTVQLIRNDAESQGIRIVRDSPGNLMPIWVDSERIIQAMLNVCLNAIDAMESGGTLTITAQTGKGSDTVEIVIADTGHGIAEDDLPKVSDPFFTKKSSGTGLGLAIVQKIIDYHEGTVEIESPLSVGTTVTISLPSTTN